MPKPAMACCTAVADASFDEVGDSPIRAMEPGDLRAQWGEMWRAMLASLDEHRAAHEAILNEALGHAARAATDEVHVGSLRWDKAVVDDAAAGPPGRVGEEAVPEEKDGGRQPEAPEAEQVETQSAAELSEIWERRELAIEVDERLQEIKASAAADHGFGLARRVEEACLEAMRRWLTIEEPPVKGRVAEVLGSAAFRVTLALAIAANTIFMILATDMRAERIGSAEALPLEAQVAEVAFILFFLVELLMKFWVHRLYFFCNHESAWNLFDLLLVVQSLIDVLTSATTDGSEIAGNVSFLRSLRVLRFARSLRVVRVLEFMAPLRRMVMSVTGSVMSLFWSLAMLLFVTGMCGLMMVEVVINAIATADLDDAQKESVMQMFGSVAKATLSFYMATSGGNDWSAYYDAVCGFSAGAAFIVIFVVAYMQIAMLNILTGMFVEAALKSAEPDHEEQALLQRRARFMQARELERFFRNLPPQAAGKITKADLVKIATDPKLNAAFQVFGFEVRDADLFYEVLRKTCGVDEVDLKFMVDACMGMKGPASSIEMQTVCYRALLLDERLCNLERRIIACLGGKDKEPLPS